MVEDSSFLLDSRSFYRSCKSFLQHSSCIRDDWIWVQVEEDDDEGYMKKTLLLPRRSALGPHQNEDNDDALEQEEQVEDECGVLEQQVELVCEGAGVMQYEYHVLYSCSYQVPVLCFRASALNGRPLTLQEVWDNIHPNYTHTLQQGPWDTLTQQEHPLLGQPFFTLHPCRTEEFMRPVLQAAHAEARSVNYVVLWLSVVGPLVGLNLPLSYSTAQSTAD